MQKFRFLLPFSDQLGKIANAYSLGSIWCWNVSWTMHSLVQLHWMFQNEMYILYFMRKFLYDSYYAKVFAW